MKPAGFAAALLCISLAACNADPPPGVVDSTPSAQEAPAAATPVAAATGSTAIELFSRVAPGKGTPVPVLAGQTFSGRHALERDGRIAAFGVRIGTYHGASDGAMAITLCVQDECRTAEAALEGARDNDFLLFEFAQPLPATAGSELAFTLTRSSADPGNRVAIWVYPMLPGQPGIVDPSGRHFDAACRLMIRMA